MRYAILCPGRSLHKTWPERNKRKRYSEIIAITTAVDAAAKFTIWCAVDKIPKQLRAKAVAKNLVRWENIKKTGYTGSFFNAVVKAVAMGATKLDIYGHDMGGSGNYDANTGSLMKNDRSQSWWAKRWRQEAKVWATLKDKLEMQGIEVNEVS